MASSLPSTEKMLVPTSATQFPGSFAAGYREDHRKAPETKDWACILYTYFTDGWNDISIWKSAFIEFVGTTSICYLSGMLHTTISTFPAPAIAPSVGISNIFLISLFIYGLAPGSGGHVNPLITFATIVTSLTGFSRGVLYLLAQTMGAALAGGLIRGSFGKELAILNQGGGCYYTPSNLSEGQAYLIESTMSFILLLLAFGTGLDPRQSLVFGPKLGPLLVGCVIGLLSYSTVGLAAGYQGAQLNPSRCFAFAVARGEFSHQWIWWIGPMTGALVQATVYHIAPPYHREKALERVHEHHI